MNNSTIPSYGTSDPCLSKDFDFYEIRLLYTACVCGVFGILGNIFVILLAVKYTVRKNLHYMIINMAVSDILVSIFPFLTIALNYWADDDIFTDNDDVTEIVYCKYIPFHNFVSMMVSPMSLLIISIERFRATSMAIARRRSHTDIIKQRIFALSFSWIVPMLLNAYEPVFGVLTMDDSPHCELSYFPEAWIIVKNLAMILSFFAIFTLSALILRKLSKPQLIESSLTREQRRARSRRMVGAVRMVLCSLLLYTLCYSTLVFLQINDILFFNQINIDTCRINFDLLEYVGRGILPVFNSSLSPLIYVIFLSDFRSAAKRLLCRRSRRLKIRDQEHRPKHYELNTVNTNSKMC